MLLDSKVWVAVSKSSFPFERSKNAKSEQLPLQTKGKTIVFY